LNLRNIEKTSIPVEPINMAQTKFIGRNDRIRARAIKGIITLSNPYFSRIFIAWMIR
jgi:hypothetical protein